MIKPGLFEEVIAVDKNGKEYQAEYGVMMSGHTGFIDLDTDEEIDDIADVESCQ